MAGKLLAVTMCNAQLCMFSQTGASYAAPGQWFTQVLQLQEHMHMMLWQRA